MLHRYVFRWDIYLEPLLDELHEHHHPQRIDEATQEQVGVLSHLRIEAVAQQRLGDVRPERLLHVLSIPILRFAGLCRKANGTGSVFGMPFL